MESIAVLVVGVLLLAVYMIPTLTAFSRGHASKWGHLHYKLITRPNRNLLGSRTNLVTVQ